ncbi:hypothetical protein FQN57_005653 [Myotisia sp. PD_48]|nr:hypothetical protein FQN57_005653 [Myotisia sp. PD_48]
MAAPTQFAYRTSKEMGIVDAYPVYEALSDRKGTSVALLILPAVNTLLGLLQKGSLASTTPKNALSSNTPIFEISVKVIDPSVGHLITTLPADNVYELGFSPLGTYLITWQRPSKDENGDATKNLSVWKVVESPPTDNGVEDQHTIIGRFVQKSQTGWNLQYSADEKYCAKVVTNEVKLFESGDLANVWKTLRVEGVADFAVSPGKDHAIAVFIPERKGQPSAVRIYRVPDFKSPVSQKTFYKGDKVQMKWNNTGTTLLVLAQTEVDKTGKSYYGETTLYLLSVNGTFDSRIDLDKEGPIHDVTWSPTSNEFGVVYGYMPAKTTIFNSRANVVHSFQLGPRNTINFSPTGRFVIVAGFGNLAGQMDIYDLQKDFQKITTVEASNASVCEWSPDGKHILTATTSPRLRVDNGVRIWHVSGGLMYNEDMSELYDVCWRPQSATSHPADNPLHPIPAPHASALAYLSTKKTPSKPAGAYRPPGARGQSTPVAFLREDEGGSAFKSDGTSAFGSNAVNGFGRRRRGVPGAEPADEFLPPGAAPGGGVALPPGAEANAPLSKTAAKNKKKREAKKAKENAERAANLGVEGEPAIPTGPREYRRSQERSRSRGPARQPRNADNANNLGPGGASPGKYNRDRSRSTHRRQRSDARNTHRPNGGGPPNGFRGGHSGGTPRIVTRQTDGGHAPDVTITSPGGDAAGGPDKKIRGLLKKLRAIDELKMREAGGEQLEETQVKKIRTEDSVRGELESLGWSG